MLLPTQPAAGQAVRALTWVGNRRIAEALMMLKQKLSEDTVQELIALRPALPVWLSKSISQKLLAHG
jgi:hypothetical protein